MDADSRHKEIGKDIDHYISQRKGGGLFGWFSKKEGAAPQETVPESAQAIDVPAEQAPVQAQDTNDYPDEVPAEGEPKKGFWSKLFGGAEEPVPVEAEPAEPVVDEDMRQVAKCALRFIKMADTDAQSRIKTSDEFAQFKEILQRRQIIK